MNDVLIGGIVILFTLLGSLAALNMKKASSVQNIFMIIYKKELYVGAILYIAAALLNILALAYWDYSVVLPLTGLTYLWTILIASIYYHEKINLLKIIGLGAIIFGTILIVL